MLDNEFINKNEYNEFKKKEIKLKKKKKIFLEDSQYYIEDVRKNIIESSQLIDFSKSCFSNP